jgi:hypothetical protein
MDSTPTSTLRGPIARLLSSVLLRLSFWTYDRGGIFLAERKKFYHDAPLESLYLSHPL